MSLPFEGRGIDLVVGIESRGFILGAAVADRINAGFVLVRKVGKLPSATIKASYSLEYGTDSLEMHKDAIEPGQRVLIVDDLLATGGTAAAAVSLVKQLGGTVEGLAFLIELVELKGRDKLAGRADHHDPAGPSAPAVRADGVRYGKMANSAPVAQQDRASVS